MEYTSMSRTSTISSWSASKTVVSTSSGCWPQPGELLGVGPGHPAGVSAQAVAVRVLADGDQDLATARSIRGWSTAAVGRRVPAGLIARGTRRPPRPRASCVSRQASCLPPSIGVAVRHRGAAAAHRAGPPMAGGRRRSRALAVAGRGQRRRRPPRSAPAPWASAPAAGRTAAACRTRCRSRGTARFCTGAKISSTWSLDSVSCSISCSTRSSSTSRYWTRISQASSCAASISRRTSSSIAEAISSE